ncbi:MAG: hypothetical protein FJ288_08770 [Planctomycetes bacterium]|nr:hypothetical protein [Planctomycetota bacterium]
MAIGVLGILAALVVYVVYSQWPSEHVLLWKTIEHNPLRGLLPLEVLEHCDRFKHKVGQKRLTEADAIVLALASLEEEQSLEREKAPQTLDYMRQRLTINPKRGYSFSELVDLLGVPNLSVKGNYGWGGGGADLGGCDTLAYYCGRTEDGAWQRIWVFGDPLRGHQVVLIMYAQERDWRTR